MLQLSWHRPEDCIYQLQFCTEPHLYPWHTQCCHHKLQPKCPFLERKNISRQNISYQTTRPVVPRAPRLQRSSVPSSLQVPLVPWPRDSLTVLQTLPMREYPAPFFLRTPLKSIRFPVPEAEEGGGPVGGPAGPPARPGSANLS